MARRTRIRQSARQIRRRAEVADPDHIWDSVTDKHYENYEEIHPLQPIWTPND